MLKQTKILTVSLIVLLPLLAFGESTITQEQKIVEIQLHYDSIDKLFYTYLNMGKVNIQKNFKYLVDTGSKLSWVLQNKCTNCNERNKNILTRVCEGDTCVEGKQGTKITYGFGSVYILETYDYIRIDDIPNAQTIELEVDMSYVTSLSEELSSLQFNGLLALSPNAHNKNDSPNPFMNNFITKDIITQNLFSINFRKQDPSLIIGGIRQDLIPKDKQISYIPMEKGEEYWKMPMKDFKLGNSTILYDNPINSTITLDEENKQQFNDNDLDFKAHVDSGTNYIVVEQEINERFRDILRKEYNMECWLVNLDRKSIFSKIECVCPDGRIDKFPDLTLHFIDQNEQEVVFTIPPKQYIQLDMSKKRQASMRIISQNKTIKKDENKEVSVLEKKESKLLDNEIILGYPFLQNLYVVFDRDNYQIGLVKLDPYNGSEAFLSFRNYILVGLLVIVLNFMAAQKIIRKLN